MTDEDLVLQARRNPLAEWIATSNKWSDPGNDVWCHQTAGAMTWDVAHRYGFDAEGKVRRMQFPDQHSAVAFYFAYLAARRTSYLLAARKP